MGLTPDPVLATAKRGDLVGLVARCGLTRCDWRAEHASAVVVNEYGVEDILPSRCPIHGFPVSVETIVEVIR